ncbi:MAG: tyrosine-type recombinase/integrase [Ktedonobacterales bacterium]|nr:tyrosine-type recombinase/integrase [Ktedonobacterales bacterium]
MADDRAPAIFDEQAAEHIRRVWHDGQWFYSVIDVIGFLTDAKIPRNYWSDLKRKLAQDEGFAEPHAKIVQLKLRSPDGKLRETDCADTETLLRIIQSVPSPKAEPFKQWLARVGTERLQEMEDPALAAERLRKEYQRLGYSDAWITERQGDPTDPLFPTRHGARLSRDALEHRLAKYTAIASAKAPTLADKTVTAHVLRHSAAMRLLHAGVDLTVIALWLGHYAGDPVKSDRLGGMRARRRGRARVCPAHGYALAWDLRKDHRGASPVQAPLEIGESARFDDAAGVGAHLARRSDGHRDAPGAREPGLRRVAA